jgi:hypothetical protein
MKPDYSRIPPHTLKTFEAWVATGRYLDDPYQLGMPIAIVRNPHFLELDDEYLSRRVPDS